MIQNALLYNLSDEWNKCYLVYTIKGAQYIYEGIKVKIHYSFVLC